MTWNPAPPVRSLAPAAFAAWDALKGEAAKAVQPELITLSVQRLTALLGTCGAGSAATPPRAGEGSRGSCAEAIEQFVIDVSAFTDAQRSALAAELGAATYPFVQTLYVYDMDLRLQHALAQLFGEPVAAPTPPAARVEPDLDLWPPLDRFLTVVAALDQLDPVTTELVRLRGARAHNCRICQSRRSVTAVEAGAGESTFEAIDDYESSGGSSGLDERHKVALRLTDAMIWRPADFPAGLAAAVRASFAPAQALEIVLDVVRNAANKVAVALQADAALVESGVEYFRIDPDGTLAYGLAAPAGA